VVAVDQQPLAVRPQESKDKAGQATSAPKVDKHPVRNSGRHSFEGEAPGDLISNRAWAQEAKLAGVRQHYFKGGPTFLAELPTCSRPDGHTLPQLRGQGSAGMGSTGTGLDGFGARRVWGSVGPGSICKGLDWSTGGFGPSFSWSSR
jgi:hypothetical protein